VLARVFRVSARHTATGVRWSDCLSLVRKSAPFALWSILALIYFRVDAIMLEEMRGLHELGIYGAAYRLFEVGATLPVAITAALLPAYSRAAVGPAAELHRLHVRSYHRQCWMAASLGLGLIGVAGPLVHWIWTDRFVDSTRPLIGLGAALAYSTMYAVNGAGLTALNRGRVVAWLAFVAVVINVALNLYVIPRWGGTGAAWTTAATEAWLLAASTVVMMRLMGLRWTEVVLPTVGITVTVTLMALWASVSQGVAVTGGSLLLSLVSASLMLGGTRAARDASAS
jgi:O-antigen/teichoic acid export membrane protein